jgi:Dockerin type I domain
MMNPSLDDGTEPIPLTGDSGPGVPPPIIVGPNVRVNAPQSPPPAGRLGRSETTIAVANGGDNLVAGWNDATGFGQEPFSVPPVIPGTPGLSGFAFSSDGGNTWVDGGHPMTFPATTPFFSGDVVTRGDPWLITAHQTSAGMSPGQSSDVFLYSNLAVFKQLDSNGGIVDAGISIHSGTFTGSTFSWNSGQLLTSPNAPFDSYDKESMAANGKNVVVGVTNFIGISAPGTNPATCQFGGGFGQIEIWRSSDGGQTFQGPSIAGPDQTDLTDPNCLTGILNQGSDEAVANGGGVFVAWARSPNFLNGSIVQPVTGQIVGAFSANNGQSFSSPVVIQPYTPARFSIGGPPVGYNRPSANDFPRVAIDRDTGRIYVAFEDASVAGNGHIGGNGTVCLPASGNPSPGAPCPAGQRRVLLGGGADTDIYLTFSDDQGTTWSTPTLINPAAGDGKIQLWPVVTVGPDGAVNVVYYESREVQLNPDPTVIECSINIGGGLTRRSIRSSLVDTFISRSLDHGKSFQAPVRLSSATSNWCKSTVNIRPNFGDYISATTLGARTFSLWADDRNTIMINGTPRNVVDVFYTTARTKAGDVNGDFNVNVVDLATIALSFNARRGDANWLADADLNNDGVINIIDLATSAINYNS